MYHLLRNPDGHTLEVKDAGPRNGQALLLFHGLGASASSFPAEHLDPLAIRLLVMNRPGTGASMLQPYTAQQLVEDAAWVLDHLGITRCTVGGWDAGAVYALVFAQAYPERTDSLHLWSPALPPGDRDASAVLPARWKGLRRLLPFLDRGEVRHTARALVSDPDRVLREQAAAMPEADQRIALALEWRDVLLRSAREGYAHEGSGVLADSTALHRAHIDWSAIRCPVHIRAGGQDNVWPPATTAWLKERLPAARLHIDPQGGHLHFLAEWERYLASVKP